MIKKIGKYVFIYLTCFGAIWFYLPIVFTALVNLYPVSNDTSYIFVNEAKSVDGRYLARIYAKPTGSFEVTVTQIDVIDLERDKHYKNVVTFTSVRPNIEISWNDDRTLEVSNFKLEEMRHYNQGSGVFKVNLMPKECFNGVKSCILPGEVLQNERLEKLL